MLRDEQACTPEIAAEVVARFREFLTRAGKSQAWAAKSMGKSESTLSQLLSGTYNADAEPHVRDLDRWLETQLMREAAPKPPGFVRIGVANKVYVAARYVEDNREIALVTGPGGVGKTITLQAIRSERPGSIYVSISSAGHRVSGVLRAIAKAIHFTGPKLNNADLFDGLVHRLKDSERLIMVDEVHKLAGRARDEALHVLRDLHDQTGCPMLWAGNTLIKDYIDKGATDGNDPLDQIKSRIGWWVNLTDVANKVEDGDGLYTVADLQKVFAAAKIRLTGDGTSFLQGMANTPGCGGLRACRSLVMKTLKVARDQPIDARMLRSVLRQSMGRVSAEHVERQIADYVGSGVAVAVG